MAEVNAFSARFEQTLYDADGDTLQTSSGTVVLERPARFRWEYAASDSDASGQVLVADGERVWLYDPDLEQVTVNRIDERVASVCLRVILPPWSCATALGRPPRFASVTLMPISIPTMSSSPSLHRPV